MTRATLLGLAALAAAGRAHAQGEWKDPSPHRVAFVAVRPDVTLEVLEWGGQGPALVLLAGYGDTAHVFDGFAVQFTDRFRVVGITRRGFGASSRPLFGYDTPTLAGDIVRVLDSLGIRRAAFAGHSFGGSELNYLGVHFGERVTRLVYLDASFDFPRLAPDQRWKRSSPTPKPPLPHVNDLDSLTAWYVHVLGPGFPKAEVRAMNGWGGPTPSTAELEKGESPSELDRIRVPVLALWAAPRRAEDFYPYLSLLDAGDRQRTAEAFSLIVAVRHEHLQRFRKQVRGARIVEIPGGRHYIFLSHRGVVTRAMREFLPPGG